MRNRKLFLMLAFLSYLCTGTVQVQVPLFIWPVEEGKFWLSSYFGPRKKPNGQSGFHNGIDMAALKGTRVSAAAEGTVLEAYSDTGYGKTIVIQHDGPYKTRYAHLDKIRVVKGQRVIKGQWIGDVGATGNVRTIGKDPSHLHFEVYENNQRVNPMRFLKKEK